MITTVWKLWKCFIKSIHLEKKNPAAYISAVLQVSFESCVWRLHMHNELACVFVVLFLREEYFLSHSCVSQHLDLYAKEKNKKPATEDLTILPCLFELKPPASDRYRFTAGWAEPRHEGGSRSSISPSPYSPPITVENPNTVLFLFPSFKNLL